MLGVELPDRDAYTVGAQLTTVTSPSTSRVQVLGPSYGRQIWTGVNALNMPVNVMKVQRSAAAGDVQRALDASRAAQAYLGMGNL